MASILEAAAQVLETGGLEGFNTNAVARRAGVSIGSLYQYFPTKDALTIALIRREDERFRAEAMRALDAASGEAAMNFLITACVRQQLRRPVLARLLDVQESRPEFREEVKRYKFRGSSGKVNLALDALPNFTCMPGEGKHLRGAISISPSVDYMERAYDDAKYGRYSRRPYIDMVIPSLTDPSVAPPGKHVMSCFVQYAPYKLKEGTWDEKGEEFGDNVINTVAEYAPNLKDIIVGRQVVTPLDLEREWGLTEGNIFQGELTLEQLFFLRPVPGYAQYKTPIKNLWMCGSATHPGGGIMGANGRLAALEILKQGKGSN